MSTETIKEKVLNFAEVLGLTGVTIGGIWGFYMALKLLFTVA